MNVQTLVVTTNQTDHSLVQKMNIQTNAVIGNQCDYNRIDEFEYNEKSIQYLSFKTRGVGSNRNETLLHASGDICVLADDDMIFLDGYEQTVLEWFEKIPDADMLVFNLRGGKASRYRNSSVHRVNRLNYGKYGTARLAFRIESVRFSGVMFHTQFGGGSRYSCGEDTIFLRNCLQKKLRLYAVPAEIAEIDDSQSSWFNGYSEKFFFDKGVLYYVLNPKFCRIHSVIHCCKYRKKYQTYGMINAIRAMWKGIRSVT